MDQEMRAPIPVFISYAPKDESYRKELEMYLAPHQRRGFITISHQCTIAAGSERRQELDAAIDTAELIFLLLSAHYEASDECQLDMERALARHHAGNTIVIPLLLRSVSLEDSGLAGLQCLPRNGQSITHFSGSDRDEIWSEIVSEIRTILKRRMPQPRRNEERTRKLKAMIADHSGFMRDRLNSFVGRQSELTAIQERIKTTMKTGGYVTITGQAGQGKSSIIARLVEQANTDTAVCHFIPLNPGPDHQVGLLRNLMARLILKHDLSDLYVASDSRAALRDYFPKVLQDVVAQGKQEVIFIDGLDQLEEDLNGHRDLSFLPNDIPAGIVFVLGTRPDDTLHPLELLKPFDEYRLPDLSRQDFDLILAHRQVQLERVLVDQFYEVMKQNALYLDLAAKELMQAGQIVPAELIARVANNPGNLFSLALARLKRQPLEWREVIKPMLGLLLVAREPLKLRQIRSILQVEDERLRDGLQRLGGLLMDAGLQSYTLFHLKLRDYLRQDEQDPQKEYVFAADEEEGWHGRLATWCEQGGLASIWQDTMKPAEQERRVYARKHLIAHLYYAHKWDHLFEVLDEGSYGHAKERYDVTGRSYIEDLDFGRRAAAWEGWTKEEALTHFPHLWQYTLLRCSLRSRSDNYPDELFRLMLLLGREQEVLGHVELLTNAGQKADVLQIIATHVANQPGRQAEQWPIFQRSCEIARAIPDKNMQGSILRGFVYALVEAERWEQAQEIAHSITDSNQKAWALQDVASALARAERWEQAQEIIDSITEGDQKALALQELVGALAEAGRWEQAEEIAYSITESHQQASTLQALADISAKVEKCEQAEYFWQRAKKIIPAIKSAYEKIQVLVGFANILVNINQWEQAEIAWLMAEEAAYSIIDSSVQVRALVGLAKSLSKAGKLEKADFLYLHTTELLSSINTGLYRMRALDELIEALAEAGKWEQAENLWKEAIEMAHSFGGTAHQTTALRNLVDTLVEIKQLAQAKEVAYSIPKSKEKAGAIARLGIALFEEQADDAEILCRKSEEQAWIIEDRDHKSAALSRLAGALVTAKRWSQAEEVARSIIDTTYQGRALSDLAGAWIKMERWEQAEEVARSIVNTNQQVMMLSRLVGALVNAGRWGRAEEIVQAIEIKEVKMLVLGNLASILWEMKYWERAQSLWKQAIEIARSISDGSKQIKPLTLLLRNLASEKQEEQLASLQKIIEEVIHTLPESGDKIKALSTLATILDSIGQEEQAELLWKKAEYGASSLLKINERELAMRELVKSLARAKRWKQAEGVAWSIADSEERSVALRMLIEELIKTEQWDQTEEVARSIKNGFQKSIAFTRLVMALANTQQWKRAEELLTSIERESNQVEALSSLAVALSKAERWEQAEHFWMRAEEVAYSGEIYEQSVALRSLAVALAQAGRWVKAEEVTRSITESVWQAWALEEIVGALLRSGNHAMVFAFVQRWCLYIEAQESALQLFSAAVGELVALSPDMGVALSKSFQWVDASLKPLLPAR